jgi:hypothetical protein
MAEPDISGGAAVAWPLVARAQQAGQMRRIGVFMNPIRKNARTGPANQFGAV